jgi:hypothetical protein
MPDFAALIDGAITGAMRRRLASFLATDFQHVEFGRARKLDAEEVVLVLSAVDHFLLNDSLTGLCAPDLDKLVERLAAIAAQEDALADENGKSIRNACFDALACIRALEAALSRRAHEAAIMSTRLAVPCRPANDP